MKSRPRTRPPPRAATHTSDGSYCEHFHRAVELLGKRWTGAIVVVLQGGPRRFSDIGAAIPGLSDRLLSARLKELEFEGIVARHVTPSAPVRIAYQLTQKGRALEAITARIAEWAHTWGGTPRSRRRR